MKYLYLVWKNLGRRKLRTLLTVFSTIVAFVLFGLLAAVRLGFSAGVEVSGVDRMLVTHKVSIILPLPISYQETIRTMPGVRTYMTIVPNRTPSVWNGFGRSAGPVI